MEAINEMIEAWLAETFAPPAPAIRSNAGNVGVYNNIVNTADWATLA